MTDIKLLVNKDDSQVAKLAMDGCNMGIQSLSEFINKYEDASSESIAIAKKIVKQKNSLCRNLKNSCKEKIKEFLD